MGLMMALRPLGVVLAVFLLLGGCGDSSEVVLNPVPTTLASRPPMGWNTWNHFACNIDEALIRESADALVESGMRDAGYRYVNIDDCWQAYERDANGILQAHPQRFAGGIKALADYVHARGLKLGVYATPGTHTCANLAGTYPGQLGSLGHEEQDARTFAAWGVDYLKYDWCGANHDGLTEIPAFTKMSAALRATGRPIVYSLSEYGQEKPWLWGPDAGANLWRTTPDIVDLWGRVPAILKKQAPITAYSLPGGWNDPDMLEVGNGGMTDDEYRTHFGMWALLNAPLLAGNDVRAMSAATRDILLNHEVIAVDQDWSGTAGFKLRDDGSAQVWEKPMSDGSVVAALLNLGEQSADIAVTAAELGLPAAALYATRDLWAHADGEVGPTIAATVPRHAVVMYRMRVK
jgi:alpha-galactosidase